MQCGGFQRLVDDDMTGHKPGPSPTTRHAERASTHAQALQRVAPSVAVVPAQPEAFAHMPPNPAREGVDVAAPVGIAEIVPPSNDVALPLFTQLLAGEALPGIPECAHPILEPLDGLWRRTHLSTGVDAKAQQRGRLGAARATLGGVDFQVEVRVQPPGQALQHPLGGPFAGDEHGDVVGVAHKRQAPLFQFPVQPVWTSTPYNPIDK